MAMKAATKPTADTARAVLVTTQHRGVFFGYEEARDGNTITLSRARNCVYWNTGLKGFLGLASDGPNDQCKIGPAASRLELMDVTSIADCTPAAIDKWESAPWAR